MKKIICTECHKAFIALGLAATVYLICLADETRPSQKPKENELESSENWKVYSSLVGIWPQLKKEGIENIRFCLPLGLEYGEDNESDLWGKGPFGFREEAANIVRWWPTLYKVPDENLPECIKIIDKAIKSSGKPNVRIGLEKRMLIDTKKGKYIIPVRTELFHQVIVSGREWDSHELGEFIVKYCDTYYGPFYFIPPKEQTIAILLFFEQKHENGHDSMLIWPPIALFGDKKEAEKLLGRSFEPKMVFEGRDWLEKIIDAFGIALKEAKEANYVRNDSAALKEWIVFLTQDEFYWKGIGIDDGMVISEYIKGSKELKKYFDELGITKELMAGEPNAVGNPQVDKTEQN